MLRRIAYGCLRIVAVGVVCTGGAVADGAHTAVPVTLDLTSTPAQIAVAGGPKSDLEKGGKVVLRPDEYAYFIVEDYDPILYSYDVASQLSETDSAKAIDAFVDAVKGFGGGGGKGGGPPGLTCVTSINGVQVSKLKNALPLVDGVRVAVVNTIPALAAVPAPTLATTATAQLGIINGRLSALGAGGLAAVSDDLDTLSKADKSLGSGAIKLNASCSGGPVGAGGVSIAVALDNFSQASAAVQSQIAAVAVPARQGIVGVINDQVSDAEHLARLAPDVQTTIQKIQAFIKDLGTVGVPTPLPKSSQDFNASQNNTVTIKVTANQAYAGFLQSVKPAVQPKIGSYKVLVAPHESWHVAVSGAAIYSFVKAPTYSVQTTNSQLAIAQTSNDYNKVSGAVMLDLTPDRYYGELFEPHFQIGIAPDSSKLAFMLGLGFAAGPLTEFSFGAIYQKTTVLGSGLSVGQVVTSTQALKTDTTFKTGFYLSIGVKLAQSK